MNFQIVYHSLVKPKNRILNYLTKYSGITAEKLEGVTTDLQEVQESLSKILPADAILVGHSLDSDLHALKVISYHFNKTLFKSICRDCFNCKLKIEFQSEIEN